jgi:transketolase
MEIAELESLARQIRFKLVQMSHSGGAPHLGSSLSCVDILVSLYWEVLKIDPHRPDHPDRDRCILSKGHAATTLYAALALRGFFSPSLLDRFAEAGGCLPEHPSRGSVPGVEVASGSLGHGLSLALGMALSARIQKRDYRVFAVLSDGECNEGSVWEAALLAPAHHLGNLAAVIDYNKWQATGRSNEVMSLAPLADKWRSFGWNTCEVDGHDIAQLTDVLKPVPTGSGKPTAVIAHTVKAKGVSFMEDDNNWHYRIPDPAAIERARVELLGNYGE